MTSEELIEELSALPDRIHAEELNWLTLQHKVEEHRFLLKTNEAQLLAQEYGPISGKNAEVRQAQLHQQTAPERVLLLEKETQAAVQKAKVEKLRNLLVACEAMARLVSPS